jgi:hypothetical protein
MTFWQLIDAHWGDMKDGFVILFILIFVFKMAKVLW